MRYALLACLAAAAPLQAALQVQATAEPARIYVGQIFEFKIAVSGGELAEAPELPKGPYAASPMGTASQLYIVNGRRSQTVTYTWRIQPRQEGTLTIPALALKDASGREHRTQPVSVTVAAADKDPLFFLEISGPERTIYPEQEFQVALTIYAACLKPPNAARDPFPTDRGGRAVWPALSIPWLDGVEGLLSEDRDAFIQRLNPQARGAGFTINRLQLRTGFFFDSTLALFALPRTKVSRAGPDGVVRDYFAYTLTRSFRGKDYGEFPIGAVVAEGYILFDGPSEIEYRKVYTVSRAVAAAVSPPPQTGRPASFSGAVGSFRARADAAPLNVRVGDPIVLTLAIDGQGTFDHIAPPALSEQAGFEKFKVYDQPTAEAITDPHDKTRVVDKRFVYRIRPAETGIDEIPAIEFSFFDPALEKYVTARTEPIPLSVEEGKTLLAEDIVTPKTQEGPRGTKLEATGRGIAADYDRIEALVPQTPFTPWGLPFFFLGVLPPLLYAAGAGALAAHRRLNADPVRRRARRAFARAHAGLAAARQALAAGAAAAFYPALAEAASGFVADRLNLPEHGVTSAELAARLAAAGVQDALISATVAFLDRCDAARFSPGGVAADAMQRDYARAQEILRELRRAL